MNFWNEKDKKEMTTATSSSKSALETAKDAAKGSETVVAELNSDLVKKWGTVQSALSAGSKVEGKLAFDRPVRIDGELVGEVKAKDALILIGPDAKVQATLEVAYLVVMGTVEGSVKATEKIDLMAGGSISGDITTPKLMVQDGGELNGKCSMSSKPAVKAEQSRNGKSKNAADTKRSVAPHGASVQ